MACGIQCDDGSAIAITVRAKDADAIVSGRGECEGASTSPCIGWGTCTGASPPTARRSNGSCVGDSQEFWDSGLVVQCHVTPGGPECLGSPASCIPPLGGGPPDRLPRDPPAVDPEPLLDEVQRRADEVTGGASARLIDHLDELRERFGEYLQLLSSAVPPPGVPVPDAILVMAHGVAAGLLCDEAGRCLVVVPICEAPEGAMPSCRI